MIVFLGHNVYLHVAGHYDRVRENTYGALENIYFGQDSVWNLGGHFKVNDVYYDVCKWRACDDLLNTGTECLSVWWVPVTASSV